MSRWISISSLIVARTYHLCFRLEVPRPCVIEILVDESCRILYLYKAIADTSVLLFVLNLKLLWFTFDQLLIIGVVLSRISQHGRVIQTDGGLIWENSVYLLFGWRMVSLVHFFISGHVSCEVWGQKDFFTILILLNMNLIYLLKFLFWKHLSLKCVG